VWVLVLATLPLLILPGFELASSAVDHDAQQSALLKRLMQTAAARGCHTASCPILGYTSLEPLVNAGFGRGNRIVHAYLTLWNGPHPEPISSLYIDVF